jgi:hypothetical protein
MAKSPPPWPEDWGREYVDTICFAIGSHQDAIRYATRLQIVRRGFPPYWEGFKKTRDRSLFEVRREEIRWYVESLMNADLPGEAERLKLQDQYRDLVDYGARSLLTQFPFLDPNVVQKAKADCLADCYRNIEFPLLPVFLHALSEAQIEQMKQRWHAQRYTRVDLWRQIEKSSGTSAVKQGGTSGGGRPDYLLAQRSLAQLRAQLWTVVTVVPDYYRAAVANATDWQRRHSRARLQARNQEEGPQRTVLQAEYIGFLLAALLETPEIPKEGD